MIEPNHQVWSELEQYFGTRFSDQEKYQIIETMKPVLAQYPDLSEEQMTDVTLHVVEKILHQRRQVAQRR